MKSIDNIIKETIDRYLNENVFDENMFDENVRNSHKGGAKASNEIKKAFKTYNQKTDAQKKYERSKTKEGNNVSSGDEQNIRNNVDGSGIINVAALAKKVYPNHTSEGAQSQLRKKLKGLTNDNGSEYHIKEREAAIINKELKEI